MKLPVIKKFAIHYHEAKKAGNHFDIRFQIPDNSGNWDSFATKKKIPLTATKYKILVFRTRIHSEKEALFTGEIKEGYGAGKLTLWDEGKVEIEKYNPRHIILFFYGKKIKGRYHLLSSYYTKFNDKTKIRNQKFKAFLFFKAKDQM